MLRLRRGAITLDLAPERGGGVLAFHHGHEPVFADVRGEAADELACIPLVPFANRIAQGAFRADGRQVQLPILPGEVHALHGQGWLMPWRVETAGIDHAMLRYDHAANAWPWAYRAVQVFTLAGDGYCHEIAVTNCADTAMPAGIGVHPWFSCNATTQYRGLQGGEWQNGADGLPATLQTMPASVDWWHGKPVMTRTVDTCFTGRDGALGIVWPERGLSLAIFPSERLGFTHVYVPPDVGYFCVEPVSHMPDAINRAGETGLVWLAPGATLSAQVDFRVSRA